MASANNQNNLLVLGVHLKSEGYPNTLYRLHDLEASSLFRMTEINVPMQFEGTHNLHGLPRLIRTIWQTLFAHIAIMARYLATANRPDRIYVPYPSVFVLFLLSFLPARHRPRRVVADVFISLYDTIVLDRRLLKQDGIVARVLKWIEKRAYVYADKLVVDTQQNARFLSSLFELPEAKITVIPLSTDEIHFQYTPYHPRSGICRVLFVGTLVPLHGLITILEAARLLSERPDIRFTLIGDGQDAPLVEAWLHAHAIPLEWKRTWHPSSLIAEEIRHADICLGIFGAGDKTQRVCPFKLYAYASVGRAIITGKTDWLKAATEQISYEPFANVPVNDPAALAAKITQLANDQPLRTNLAESSHWFYKMHLGNQSALEKLSSCLRED